MPYDEQDLTIELATGPVSAVHTRPVTARATVVVAHGAGAGMEHPFMVGFTRGLADVGLASVRFNFAYREMGRKFPDRAPAAIDAWRAVLAHTATLAPDGEPIWAAGKSFGARMASMAVADGMPAAGLVFLGYPLHAPGKPETPRDEHLYRITAPMLFLQGTRDPFALPNRQLDEVVARIGQRAVLDWIVGGDHSFDTTGHPRGKKPRPEEVAAALAPRVGEFVRARASTPRTRAPEQPLAKDDS